MDGPPSITSVVARPDLRLTDTSYSNEHSPPSVGSIALAQLQLSDPLTDTAYNNDAPPSVGSMAIARLQLSDQHTDTSYHNEQPPSLSYDKGVSQSATDGFSYDATPPSLTCVAVRNESYSGPGLMQCDSYSASMSVNNYDDASTIDPDADLDYLQVEVDNIGSKGNTSSTHKIAASKKANLMLEMIRLYSVMFGKDDTSSSAIIPMDFASTDRAEMERMISRIYRETICPMFSADFNKMHQNFLFMIRKKFGLELSTGVTWNLCTSTSQSLQLKFLYGILTPVHTATYIKGKEKKPFLVALVDGTSGQIVTTGAEASMEVEIVVLESDSSDDVVDNWTSDEFNGIVEKWKGLKLLQGNTFVKLDKGIVSVDKISFTHSTQWLERTMCRMGARSVDAGFLGCVKEAKTEPFSVIDRLESLYGKYEIPSLSDPLYRLHMFSRRGNYFEPLIKVGIKTVMDLLTYHAINPQRLKKILGVHPNQYKIIMDHAKACKDDKGIYWYHYPSDGQTSNGVAFNISGKLVGIIAGSHFVPYEKVPDEKRVDAQKLIAYSSEHWEEVVAFNDQDSLIKHLQPRTTLNPSSHNNLNVVLPQSFDPHNHTNLTSPISQSPKRPASEHEISNSPKQPRYEHPKPGPSIPSVGLDASIICEANNLESKPDDDDDDILMYLDLPDTWKIVCYAVGWICMISKTRKRRTAFGHDNTVMMIAASID